MSLSSHLNKLHMWIFVLELQPSRMCHDTTCLNLWAYKITKLVRWYGLSGRRTVIALVALRIQMFLLEGYLGREDAFSFLIVCISSSS